jgi:hypothetical protein
MDSRIYEPSAETRLTPIEGLRYYADALRGDWGSIDGRSEKAALNEYIDWAREVDAATTTEADVMRKLESILGVYVIEEWSLPDYHDRRGIWHIHAEDEIAARDEASASVPTDRSPE